MFLGTHRSPIRKMFNVKGCIVFVTLFYFGLTVEVPTEFQKCKRTSNNQALSKCLFDSITAALPKLNKEFPEIGLSTFQPIKVKNFTVGEGTGIVHVVQNYKDVEIYNLIHAKLKKLNASLTDRELSIKAEAYSEHLQMLSNYDMDGRLLVFKFFGKGKSTLDLHKVKVLFTIHGTTYKKNGETYLKFDVFKTEIEPKKIKFNFENLFNGDKALGDNINKILNDNDLDVYQDVKKGYEKEISGVLKNIANTFVSKIPFNKLFA